MATIDLNAMHIDYESLPELEQTKVNYRMLRYSGLAARKGVYGVDALVRGFVWAMRRYGRGNYPPARVAQQRAMSSTVRRASMHIFRGGQPLRGGYSGLWLRPKKESKVIK